jgi:stage V sporulation protein B
MAAVPDVGGRIFADSVITLAIRVGNIVVAAAIGIFVSRALGPEGRALYQIPAIMAALATASFSGLAIATCYSMLNEKRGRGALRTAFLAGGVFVAGGIAAVAVLGVLLHAQWAIGFAAISLPLAAIVNIATGYWYGVANVRYATFLGFAVTAAVGVAIAAGFIVFGRSAQHAIVMWLTGTGAVTLFVLIAMTRHARHLPNDRVPLGPFLAYALKVGLTNLVSLLNYRVDVYIVAILLPPTALGLYTVAVTAAEALNTVAQVAPSVTLPYITALDHRQAAELTARCARVNIALTALMATATWYAAPYLIVGLYGTAFSDAAPALRSLLGGSIALAAGSVVSSYFTLNRGQPYICLTLSVVMAVEGGVLTLVLVPVYGIVGAGLATTISYITGFCLATVVFVATGGGSALTLAVIRPSDIRTIVQQLQRYQLRRGTIVQNEPTDITA